MTLDFKHASAVEGVRFTAQVGIPNVIQGLFKKRETPSTVASLASADRLAYGLVHGLIKKYGPDPFYVRVATDEALLVHHPEDIEFVLGGSPSPFASDPDPKKKGMSAFQPDALTLSRGDLWENRRRFAEAVLDTGKPLHRQATAFLKVVAQEADTLLAVDGPLEWDDVNEAFQRITRRVVFGDAAADDNALTSLLGDLMAAGNKMPGKPADGYDELIERITLY
ncbi:MAG: cytochrome P450, partial [Aeromicrobium sp.]